LVPLKPKKTKDIHMLKETTYQEKFATLQKWFPYIIESVKKDLKNEHLKNDWQFVKKYFPGKNINKLTVEELVEGYTKAIETEEASEQLGEFLTNRWLLKNTELYEYFERQLYQINPNFHEINEIEKDKSIEIMEGAISQFGAPRTYLFSVLNAVVFPQEIFQILSQRADEAKHQQHEEEKLEVDHASKETLQKHYEQQISRLTDKYEKKLQGLQKKYLQETETLKKQVVSLQRKLHG
jgi:hypothetical protein